MEIALHQDFLRFVDMLGGPSIVLHCLALDGEKPRGKFTGDVETVTQWILDQQSKGRDVVVVLQQGNGHRKENITSARVLFVDYDAMSPNIRVAPTMLVKTRRGQHAFYRLEATDDLDRFELIQRAVTKSLNGDSACTARNQRVRPPGLLNHKDPDRPVRHVIVTYDPDRVWDLEELAGELLGTSALTQLLGTGGSSESPPMNDMRRQEPVPDRTSASFPSPRIDFGFAYCRKALRRCLAEVRKLKQGERHPGLLAIAFRLGRLSTVGLDGELAQRALYRATADWADFDQSEKERVISAGFSAGRRAGPPPTPRDIKERLNRKNELDVWLKRIAALALPNEVAARDVIDQLGGVPTGFSDRAISHAIGRTLRAHGFVAINPVRRCGRSVRVFVRK